MRKHVEDPDGHFYRVVSAETGEQINNVIWADDEAGEYEILDVDDTAYLDAHGEFRTEKRTGSIRLVDTREET